VTLSLDYLSTQVDSFCYYIKRPEATSSGTRLPRTTSLFLETMKFSSLFLFPCLAHGAVVPLQTRQHSHGGASPASDHGAMSQPASNAPKAKTPGEMNWLEKVMAEFQISWTDGFAAFSRLASQSAKFSSETTIAPKLRSNSIRKVAKYGPYIVEPQVCFEEYRFRRRAFAKQLTTRERRTTGTRSIGWQWTVTVKHTGSISRPRMDYAPTAPSSPVRPAFPFQMDPK
jgi:hypothetical protein